MNRIVNKNIIQQYGFYHSGTGYIALLLHKNFKDLIILRCKKHDGPTSLDYGERYYRAQFALENLYFNEFDIDDNNRGLTDEEVNYLNARNDIKYVIIIKNPYVWCMRQIDRHPNRPVSESINNWNNANKRYYEFWVNKHHDTDCVIIRHEDLLENFDMTLRKIEDVLHLETKLKQFENVEEFSGDVHDGEKVIRQFENKYDEIRQRVLSNKTLVRQINECLDMKVIDWYNYELEKV